ncbi:hypothetical protein ACFC0D_20435 [Streptomyces sp. NPDC056222]|uniref:hypothetical protein n=1 Tax=Streptomyces sp. NPDC056222 TaxID=3345749 RepID=UPI0035E27081
MRRPGTRRGIRLGALLAGGLALAGCGIQQSDVVEVGGPATVAVAPGEGGRMLLFYVDADGGLMPVAREMGGPIDGWDDYRMPVGTPPPTYPLGSGIAGTKALAALLAGPNKEEKAAGLATRLPGPGGRTDKGIPYILPRHDTTGAERTLRIHVPFHVGELDGVAIRQLVCTVAYNEETDGRTAVVLAGPDGSLPAERCDDLRVGTAVTGPSESPDATARETGTGGTGRTGTGGTDPSGATHPEPSTTSAQPRQTPTP